MQPPRQTPADLPEPATPPRQAVMAKKHLLFVTGKLAEPALRRTLADLAPQAGFDFSIAKLPITVAALMTTSWVARHLIVPGGVDRIILPGLCAGDLADFGT